MVVEYLGWAATAVFVGSYFCRRIVVLRRVQMVGASMWVAYARRQHYTAALHTRRSVA
jgi:hypothetical protein